MRVGFVMLAHEALGRAGQVAASLARQGAPVAVHIDSKAQASQVAEFDRLVTAQHDLIRMPRRRCEWGTWSLVATTIEAVERLLREHPDVTHVCLISGACLPLRSVAELTAFLETEPDADFIESVSVSEVPWIQGGLGAERFDYSFPFAFKRHRLCFEAWTKLQRRLGRKRGVPSGLSPHLGSQWWCLRRETLTAIMSDPERGRFDRFFRRSWIPDESYFQTLVRRHARHVISRSLTHARFDWKGRPHILYDDHLSQLQGVDAFFARKIWRGADGLYGHFLDTDRTRSAPMPDIAPDIWGIARRSRVHGRPGLLNSGRFPWWGFQGPLTARPYLVFSGFDEVYEDFDTWLRQHAPEILRHGRLFANGGAQFAGGVTMTKGGLSNSPRLRDYNPEGFLGNLIGFEPQQQSFHLSPSDRADLWPMISRDCNAQVFAIRGAFLCGLSRAPGADVRTEAARCQEREEAATTALDDPASRAQVRSWTLADVALDPVAPIRAVLGALNAQADGPVSMPRLRPMDGLDRFLTDLSNAGMTPRVAGNASVWRQLARDAKDHRAEHG